MPYFGVEGSEENFQYFFDMKERFENSNAVLMAMYRTRLKFVNGMWIIDINPRLPKAYFLGMVLLGVSYFMSGMVGLWALWGYIPAGLMLFTYVFWWRKLYHYLLKRSFKRYGKTLGSVIDEEELLGVVFFGATRDI